MNHPSSGLTRRQKFFLGVMMTTGLLTFFTGFALIGYSWLRYEFARPGPVEHSMIIDLPKGMALGQISRHLQAQGAIRDASLFKINVRLMGGARALKAGEYSLPAKASMREIYGQMREGKVVQYSLTLPEALTSAQILRRLRDEPRLSGTISRLPPEGSLLPETYHFRRGEERSSIIKRMKDAQHELLETLWPDRDENLPIKSMTEALILASIVEKETGVRSERARVAGVFINRLRRNMRLESDPTIIYGLTGGEPLGRGIRASELARVTPYNTYKIDGLPPTPICNPGKDAIRAVLKPAKTDDLFFVADGTGGHKFAHTLKEHQANVKAWRKIERRLRAARAAEK